MEIGAGERQPHGSLETGAEICQIGSEQGPSSLVCALRLLRKVPGVTWAWWKFPPSLVVRGQPAPQSSSPARTPVCPVVLTLTGVTLDILLPTKLLVSAGAR